MAFLKPAKKRNTQTGKFAACLGLVLALTPVAKAQQFQTPTIPGQTTIAIPPQFQARMEHAQALKAQMIRAQIEQGAPSEFAVKAFEAQQAYQAERAFAEYSAYLKKQEQLQKDQLRSGQLDVANDESTSSSDIAQVAYRPPMKRIPKPDQYDSDVSQATANVPSQSTFVPPVHIAPVANFSDEPKVQPSPPAQPLYSYQPAPVSNQLPPTRHAQRPTMALAQSPAAHRNPVLQQGTTRATAQMERHQARPAYRQREFILQENSPPGLQDVISGLLSKARYSGTNTRQPELAQANTNTPSAALPTSSLEQAAQNRVTQHLSGASPRRIAQQRSTAQADLRTQHQLATRSNQRIQQTQYQPARHQIPNVRSRRQSDVQHAFEMQRQMDQAIRQRRAVQQVAMIEPAQDPFNDGDVAPPPESNFLELRTAHAPNLQINPPRSNQISDPGASKDETESAQQISVLANKRQGEQVGQDNQFGSVPQTDLTQQPEQVFQPPVQDNSTQPQELLQNQSTEDLQEIDEELNRRFQEQQDAQGSESSRIDSMVDELEQDLLRNRSEQSGSLLEQITEDELNETIDKSNDDVVLQTCDEFRRELLKGSIRDIALDISPLASRNRQQSSISRSWTDRAGNIVATGKMIDLRRGYVIIEGPDGQQKVSYARLSDGDWAAISEFWQIPQLCSVGNQGDATRNWVPQTYTWKASALCHKPLFFEDVQLERYGHSHGPFTQPAYSVAHFFVNFFTVPYNSGIHRVNECEYALGFYRPGDCAPWLKNPIPISLSGAARQALVTGAIIAIP